MSAFICSDEHIATIAVRYTELLDGRPADAQEIANALLALNIASVNYRYDENTEITPCSIESIQPDLSFADLVALCSCLDYQSCELPEYSNPLLEVITAQFKANDHSGIESPLWSI